MASVEIRRCRPDEAWRVQEFIRTYWSPNHILGADDELFDWQHRDPHTDSFNYLVAEIGDQFVGILGFVCSARFDPGLTGKDTYWVALWKVRDDVDLPGLGLRMLNRLIALADGVPVSVVGIGNLQHNAIYRALGFTVGELSHYFRPAQDIARRQIVQLPDGFSAPEPVPNHEFSLIEANSDDLLGMDVDLPSRSFLAPDKSPRYFLERFIQHPRYRYRVYRVVRKDKTCGLIAVRLAKAWRVGQGGDVELITGSHALRIVDLWLDETTLAQCGPALDALLSESGAEYMDCFNFGVSADAFRSAGFARLDPDGELEVPNYLEPISKAGRRIHFSFRSDGRDFVICRADGDQDRPNLPVGMGKP